MPPGGLPVSDSPTPIPPELVAPRALPKFEGWQRVTPIPLAGPAQEQAAVPGPLSCPLASHENESAPKGRYKSALQMRGNELRRGGKQPQKHGHSEEVQRAGRI